MLRKPNLVLFALAAAAAIPVAAAAENQTVADAPPQARERIYGSEYMTHRERNRYRQRLGAAYSDAQREQLRGEHRERMRLRARARGHTLP